jgi:hypothetical protein
MYQKYFLQLRGMFATAFGLVIYAKFVNQRAATGGMQLAPWLAQGV